MNCRSRTASTILQAAVRRPRDPRHRAGSAAGCRCASKATARIMKSRARASRASSTRRRSYRNCAGTACDRTRSARAEGTEILFTRKSASPGTAGSTTPGRGCGTARRSDIRRSWDQTNKSVPASPGPRAAGRRRSPEPTTRAGPRRRYVSCPRPGHRRRSRALAMRAPARLRVPGRAGEPRLRAAPRHAERVRRSHEPAGPATIPAAPTSASSGSGGGGQLEREYRDWLPLVPNFGVLWTLLASTPCLRNHARHCVHASRASSAG